MLTKNKELNEKIDDLKNQLSFLLDALNSSNVTDFEDLSYIVASKLQVVISRYEEVIENEG